jgi:hypothetical protein
VFSISFVLSMRLFGDYVLSKSRSDGFTSCYQQKTLVQYSNKLRTGPKWCSGDQKNGIYCSAVVFLDHHCHESKCTVHQALSTPEMYWGDSFIRATGAESNPNGSECHVRRDKSFSKSLGTNERGGEYKRNNLNPNSRSSLVSSRCRLIKRRFGTKYGI